MRILVAIRHLYRRWWGIRAVRRRIVMWELVDGLEVLLPAIAYYRILTTARHRAQLRRYDSLLVATRTGANERILVSELSRAAFFGGLDGARSQSSAVG